MLHRKESMSSFRSLRVLPIVVVLTAVLVSAVGAYGQESDVPTSDARPVPPVTFENAIRVDYPPGLEWAERFSNDLGVEDPKASAAKLRERLQSAGVQPAAAEAAVEARPEVILGSVRFKPEAGIEAGLRDALSAKDHAPSFVCIVQFRRGPTPHETADLLDRGFVPYTAAGSLVEIGRISADRVSDVAALPFVHWVGAYKSEYKVSANDSQALTTRQASELVPLYVWPLAKRDVARGNALLALGAVKVRYDPIPNVYITEVAVPSVAKIAALDWVAEIEIAKFIGMHGSGLGFEPDDSRELTTSPHVLPTFNGSGIRVGVYDTGIWSAHPDFSTAVAWQYDQNNGQSNAPDTKGHGTHVAGIVAGRGTSMPTGKGVAPSAQLYVIRAAGTTYPGTNIFGYDLDDAFNRFVGQSVRLINNSWGTRFTTPGNPWNNGYDSAARIADAYADNQGITLIVSAGNEGSNGQSTVTEPGTAKNVITVGALSYTVSGDAGGVAKLASYSSRGPTADDGRLTPDIVAPGGDRFTDYGVVSCTADPWDFSSPNCPQGTCNCNGCPPNTCPSGRPNDQTCTWPEWPDDDFYLRLSGTSMAAPHVTGIASLLYQAYGNAFGGEDGLMPRDIKALLVRSAMPIHTYGTQPENGFANTDTGYGLVDAYYSIFDRAQEQQTLLWAHAGVVETLSNTWTTNFQVLTSTRRLQAILCYEDEAGVQNVSHALKHDLDIKLTAPNGTTFSYVFPANVTTPSPLEKIVVNSPSAYGQGPWTASVRGAQWSDPFNPYESERFTVLITAYFVDPYTPVIQANVPNQITKAPGEQFAITAMITNLNGLTAAGVTATLTGSGASGGDLGRTKFVGNVVGLGSSKQVIFTGLTAPSAPGTYGLRLDVDAANRGMTPISQVIQVNVVQAAAGVPLQVLYTSPADGGPQVRNDADLEIYFSKPISVASVTPASFSVVGSITGAHWGQVSFNPTGRLLTLFPTSQFISDEFVTVYLTSAVHTANGEPLVPHTFSFRTQVSAIQTQNHSGTLTQDETWDATRIHVINAALTIPPARRLTITAGTIVKVQSNIGISITVQGVLNVQGSSSNKVVITSYRDQLYANDGSGSTPSAGDWGYILFDRYTAPGSTISNAIIRYGGVGDSNYRLIDVAGGASVTVQGCSIEYAYSRALYVRDTSSGLSVQYTLIRNSPYAVSVENAASAEFLNGKILLGFYGFYMTHSASIISGNLISDCNYGIVQRSLSAASVSGNTFTNNSYPIDQAQYDLALTGNTFAGNTYQAVVVNGSLAGNTTWENLTPQGVAYYANGDLTIPAGRTLTIAAGTVVKSDTYRQITVDGVLDAQGTVGSPMVFTSYRDDSYAGDTNADGSGTQPAPTDWYGILYQGTTPNTLHDTVLRYGGYYPGDNRFLRLASGADLTLQRCTFDRIYGTVINVNDASSDLTVTGCTINVPSTGIDVANAASVSLSSTQITGTGQSGIGVYVHGGTGPVQINGCTIGGLYYGLYQNRSTPSSATGSVFRNNSYPIAQGNYDVVLSGNTFTGNTYQAVVVNGSLAGDTTWENLTPQAVAYYVSGGLTIPAGRTLTIAAGTVVKSDTYSQFTVSGVLDAQGTVGSPVVFTSYRDDSYAGDTNGDGSGTQPAPTDWYGIVYQGTTPNTLHDTVLRYGGYYPGDNRFLRLTSGADLTIQGCTFNQIYSRVINVNDAGSDLTISGGVISAPSNGYGVVIDAAAAVNISGTQITGTFQSGTGITVNGAISDMQLTGNTVEHCNTGMLQNVAGVLRGANNVLRQNVYPIWINEETSPCLREMTLQNNAWNAIRIGGATIDGFVRWSSNDNGGNPFLIESDLTVATGAVLTLDGGTIVKFTGSANPNDTNHRNLLVDGGIVIENTSALPVVFTHSGDDLWGGDTDNNSYVVPVRGNWGGIILRNQANTLAGAVLRYAGGGRSLFNPAAAYIIGNNSALRRCSFEEYNDSAVRVAPGSQPSINNCDFLVTTAYGVRNDGSLLVDAQNNYWGASDGPGSVGNGSGAQVSLNVNYSPWLTAYVPPNQQGPTITSTPNPSAVIFQPYHYDGDDRASASGIGAITWAKLLGPSGLSIDPASGLIAWTPTAPGTFLVRLRATDATGAATQTFQITVTTSVANASPMVASFTYHSVAQTTSTWDAELTAAFSEAVNVSPSDVVVIDDMSTVLLLPGFAYDGNTHILTLHVNGLSFGRAYTVFLFATIEDMAGNPLDGNRDGVGGDDYQASFSANRRGDVNGDGYSDGLDIQAFLNVLFGADMDPARRIGADFNTDGNVDMADVQPFCQCLLGNRC